MDRGLNGLRSPLGIEASMLEVIRDQEMSSKWLEEPVGD